MNETPTATTASGSERPTWLILAGLAAGTFWTVTAEMLPSGLLPSMSADLGVSAGAVGILVSAWAIAVAVTSIPLVRLTRRVPRTALLILSLAATGLANVVTAVAPDYAVALIGRILAATAHGLFWAVVVSYVAVVVEPAQLGRALSVVLAGPSLAGLVGLPAAAYLAQHIGWRTVFGGLSVVLVLTACFLWLILPRHARGGREEPRGTWDRSSRGVVLVAAAGGLVLIGHFAAFTYITALVTDFGGMDPSAIPVLLLVLGGTGAIGVVVSALLSDRLPRAAIVAAAGLVAVGLALLRLGGDAPPLFVAGIILWGFAIGAFPPILQARVLRLSTPAFRPLAGSVVVTVLNVGVAAGAALGGVILTRGQDVLVLVAAASAAAGTLGLAIRSGPSAREDRGVG